LFTLHLIVFGTKLDSLVLQILGNFVSRWAKPAGSDNGVGSKIRDSLKSPEPIKPKLDQATRQIQAQIAKLEQVSMKLKEKDSAIFSKVVISIQRNDNTRANMLASELSEIRQMGHIVTQAKLAMEQLVLRLSTVTELGDVAVTLSPALEAIRSVRPGIVNLVPEAEREIGEISGLLSGILVEAGQVNPSPVNFEVSNDEAEQVLEEAGIIARNNMSSKFPEIPEVETREPETA
jgi:division protein CdvB (Snf7/Vps24/ESCRT-III family)